MSVFQVVMFVVSQIYQRAQAKKQKERQRKMQEEASKRADEAKGMQISVEALSSPLYVAYGRCIIGGVRTDFQTYNSVTIPAAPPDYDVFSNLSTTTGQKHEFLMVEAAICIGEVNKFLGFQIDKRNFKDPDYNNSYVAYCQRTGGTANVLAVANNPVRSTAVYTGVANATVIFRLDRDEPQFNGVPSVSFYIEGTPLYGITGSPGSRQLTASKTFSSNAALCLLDYLINPVYGRGLSLSEIDLDSFYEAMLLCDKVVVQSAPIEGDWWTNKTTITPGATRTIRRFETNLGISTQNPIRDNIEKLLEGMDMAELIWSAGKYKLQLSYPLVYNSATPYDYGDVVESLGQLYRSHAYTNTQPLNTVNWSADVVASYINDDVLVTSKDLSVSWPNAQNRYNFITVKFRNEAKNFEEDSVSWPDKASTVYSELLLEDSGLQLESEIFEDCVIDYYHAKAKAEHRVRNSRHSVLYKLSVLKSLVEIEPGDIVSVQSDFYEIPQQLMRVEEVEIESDSTLTVELYSFSAAVLAWNANDTEYVKPPIQIDLKIGQVTDLTFNKATVTGSVGQLTWSHVNDIRVINYTVKVTDTFEAFINADTVWYDVGTTSNNFFDIPALSSGDRVFTVVANSVSKSSPKFDTVNNSKWPLLSVSTGVVADNDVVIYKFDIFTRNIGTPATPVGGSFSLVDNTLTPPANWYTAIPAGANTLFRSSSNVYVDTQSGTISGFAWTLPKAIEDVGTYSYLTRTVITLPQDGNGNTTSFENASGYLKAILNNVDVSASVSTVYELLNEKNCTVNLVNSGADNGKYSVTNLFGNSGYFTLRVTYGGKSFTKVIAVTGMKAGYTPDLTPPAAPSSATLSSGLNNIFVTLATQPTYAEGHGHKQTNVYVSNNIAATFSDPSTIKYSSFVGARGSFATALNTPHRVWLTFESLDSVESSPYLAGNISTGMINGEDLNPLILESLEIADGSITEVKIAANAITAPKIAAGAIAVGTAAIANGAIVNAMLGNASVDNAKIANGSITSAKIGDAEITSAKIANTIQSTNYVAGESGWKINKSGGVEFNNVVVRGEVHASSGSFAGALNAATGTFSGDISAATGTFAGGLNVKSSPTGARMEVKTTHIAVYDANGVLRVKLGNLNA